MSALACSVEGQNSRRKLTSPPTPDFEDGEGMGSRPRAGMGEGSPRTHNRGPQDRGQA